MPAIFESVYLNRLGAFLPGEPVPNDRIDRYIEPLNRLSPRIKRRILGENGILTRHYAIDEKGTSLWSNARMAAQAVRNCLGTGASLKDVTLLCTGTSGADALIPGFANMVQGELGASPMETSSHQGVCLAGLVAMNYAAMAIDHGFHRDALVVASEFPSRLFKKERLASREYDIDFDSHFLRWMLSDGAGAVLLGGRPAEDGPCLRLRWLHTRSFAGDYPVCMQLGFPAKNKPRSYADYDSFAQAEKDGAMQLRQDIRLLPHLFDLGIHEYLSLCREGLVRSEEVDHFLCHYSSQKFAPVVAELLRNAGAEIPAERWYSNLTTRGNTGAASIFIMLEEFLRTKRPRPGEKILCFVPESARFTVGFLLLEVVEAKTPAQSLPPPLPEPPHAPAPGQDPALARLLQGLGEVWHDFRSRMFRTTFVRKVVEGTVEPSDYARWMACWIPQVREGSRWMREAAAGMTGSFTPLRALIERHASDEQFDWRMLFEDYKTAGGTAVSADELRRNAGGEALNAFMHYRAGQPDPVDLLGAMFIIEGTGSRIIPTLLPLLKKRLPLPDGAYRFLRYHGENDLEHMTRWIEAARFILAAAPDRAEDIVRTARTVAELYILQMEKVL